MSNLVKPASLYTWIENEQVDLWHDLSHEIDYATNRVWSIAASGVAQRLVSSMRLVGASPNGQLPWDLVAGDVYAKLCEIAEVEPDLPTEDQWPRLDRLMGPHIGTRAELTVRMAATVAAMEQDRAMLAEERYP